MTSPTWPTIPNTFLALDPDEHSLARSKVVILPVPYDATTSYRSGARDGPAAIIRTSHELEDFDPELETNATGIGIYTAPAIEPHAGGPEAMAARVSEAVGWYAAHEKLVGMIGGDHSLTPGAVHALAEHFHDLSILVFDAHADMREEYQSTAYGHASASRRAFDHAPVTLVGVRSISEEDSTFVREHNIPIFMRWAEPIADVDAIIGGLSKNVYVSFDLDAFDPSIMAAVGTPEPGGMEWWEALRILRAVAEQRTIVGFDVMELAPGEGPEAGAFTAAKLVYKLIAYATSLPQ
jgi:agmatinase